MPGCASPRGWPATSTCSGSYDYLDVWNHERFVAKLQREPYTDDDARALSEFGI